MRGPARDALNDALDAERDGRRVTPCAGDARFTAEDRAERAAVLHLCDPCPLFYLCEAVAAEEKPTWAVYAGRDYAPPAPKPRTRKAKTA